MKLFQSETVKGAMDDADRHRAAALVHRARKATKAPKDAAAKTGSNISGHSMSVDEDNFVLIKGYTDFGTEVEYLYNPKSGEARPLESEDKEEDEIASDMPSPGGMTRSSSKTNGQKVRTMTQFDAAIEEYCEHQKQEKAKVVLPPESVLEFQKKTQKGQRKKVLADIRETCSVHQERCQAKMPTFTQ